MQDTHLCTLYTFCLNLTQDLGAIFGTVCIVYFPLLSTHFTEEYRFYFFRKIRCYLLFGTAQQERMDHFTQLHFHLFFLVLVNRRRKFITEEVD
ncbi:hypothetical protein D3C86_1342840 [compost metagenome]